MANGPRDASTATMHPEKIKMNHELLELVGRGDTIRQPDLMEKWVAVQADFGGGFRVTLLHEM